jgi:hypothetical protein
VLREAAKGIVGHAVDPRPVACGHLTTNVLDQHRQVVEPRAEQGAFSAISSTAAGACCVGRARRGGRSLSPSAP